MEKWSRAVLKLPGPPRRRARRVSNCVESRPALYRSGTGSSDPLFELLPSLRVHAKEVRHTVGRPNLPLGSLLNRASTPRLRFSLPRPPLSRTDHTTHQLFLVNSAVFFDSRAVANRALTKVRYSEQNWFSPNPLRSDMETLACQIERQVQVGGHCAVPHVLPRACHNTRCPRHIIRVYVAQMRSG